MTIQLAAPAPAPIRLATDAYQPGTCNIGPAEITRRRRTGHVGAIAAIALLVILVALDAPPLARLLIALPAAVSASGYLQAWLKFCAGFGWLGVFNFGDVGSETRITDREALARDRRKALQIGLASGAIGLLVALLALALPI